MSVVGWCHQCGTLQLLEDAPVLDWMGDGDPEPCCVVCREEEPWSMAVFPMPASMEVCGSERHVSWSPAPCEVCGRG